MKNFQQMMQMGQKMQARMKEMKENNAGFPGQAAEALGEDAGMTAAGLDALLLTTEPEVRWAWAGERVALRTSPRTSRERSRETDMAESEIWRGTE